MALISLRVPHDIARLLGQYEVPGEKESPGDFHITLVYLGKDHSDVEIARAMLAVSEVLKGVPPFTVTAKAVTTFPPTPEGKVPVIAQIESKALMALQVKLVAALAEVGVEYSKKHPDYKPHVTLAYAPPGYIPKRVLPSPITWGVGEVTLWGGSFGDNGLSITLPLSTGTWPSKVAHTKAAAQLEKSWLMAVRRGWLSLMKPSITSYPDVHKALAGLDSFVDNLKEQVFYVRRGPYTGLTSTSERAKLGKALDTLEKAISDAQSRANHWERCLEGKTPFPNPQEKADGEHMLALYKSSFEEATEGYKTSGTSKNNPYGNPKSASLTELFDDVLKILYADAKAAKDYHEVSTEPLDVEREAYKEFDLYGLKVVIQDNKLKAGDIEDYIRYLDETHARMVAKGFGDMWYGKVLIQCEECGGVNSNGAEFGVGAHFMITQDYVRIYARPNPYIVQLMAHELGHRYWFKHMNQSQRLRFTEWFTSGEVPAVSRYGQSNADEAFAEVISYFVVGKGMSRDQLDSFKATLKTAGEGGTIPHGWLTWHGGLPEAPETDDGTQDKVARVLLKYQTKGKVG